MQKNYLELFYCNFALKNILNVKYCKKSVLFYCKEILQRKVFHIIFEFNKNSFLNVK